MPELAEGARLEIVCTSKQRTVGSNPTLSAREAGVRNQRSEAGIGRDLRGGLCIQPIAPWNRLTENEMSI
jgi:hypothetical protein